MKVKDFKVKGQYPNYTVDAVISDNTKEQNINIGSLDFVSTLTEKQLLDWIVAHQYTHEQPKVTQSMKKVMGQDLPQKTKANPQKDPNEETDKA